MNETTETSRKEKLKALTERLEHGIQSVFESERYREYLSVMGRFHSYSMNNTLLILEQKPDASYVASYNTWKSLGRNVKKGEHGIQIFAPCVRKKMEDVEIWDPKTGMPRRTADGQVMKEQKEVSYTYFHPATIFDISQTEGKPLPELTTELQGQVPEYERFFDALEKASPVPIRFDEWSSRRKGYYDLIKQEIVIKAGMSEPQNIKTAVHEMAHSILHKDRNHVKDSVSMEIEAESVAYVVCQHYGLDTSEYSFGYLAGWSSSETMPELKASLQRIQQTSHDLIDRLDRNLFLSTNHLDISDTMDSLQEKISASHGISHHRR
ncbi:MAG: ArdC-like ssDNA-binding domain-containing protein [Lachnospiraceae bacterium]